MINIVTTVHKYEESNVFVNCCKLGNCVISLARPFYMFISLTVLDSSPWVVFAFLSFNSLHYIMLMYACSWLKHACT